jgi:hypothetical protein
LRAHLESYRGKKSNGPRPGQEARSWSRTANLSRHRKVEFIDEPHLIARMPDHELWMWFLRDPDGNSLALMEEKRA